MLPPAFVKVVEGPAGSTLLACSANGASIATDAATAATADVTLVPDRYSKRPLLLQPEQVSAHVLRHLLRRAQAHLEQQQPQQTAQQAQQLALQEAVITVPAYFTAEQRRATVRAAQLAGLRKATLLQGEQMRWKRQGSGGEQYFCYNLGVRTSGTAHGCTAAG